MGFYINPPGIPKEQWLVQHGQKVDNPTWPAPPNVTLVCLVDNGPFTAAAIVYKGEEFEEFMIPDGRPRIWCHVPTEKIIEIAPEVKGLL